VAVAGHYDAHRRSDHKVIDMKAFFSALVQALRDAR
jgi:hypothetical protein